MSIPKEPQWVRLPLDPLRREDFAKSDVLVLAILIDKLIMQPDMSGAVSQKEIAKLTGLSDRQTRRAEKHLEQLGLISKTRTGRETVYKLEGAAANEEILAKKKQYQKPTKSTGYRKSQSQTEEELRNMKEYLEAAGMSGQLYELRKEHPELWEA